MSNPLYHTRRWKAKRAKTLKRDKYMCQVSLRYGKRIDADTVHHCFTIEEYPELSLEDWNLLSLSNAAHNSMHDRVTNKLTDKGKRLQEGLKNNFIDFYRGNKVTNPNVINKLKEYGVIA